ncbi:hypothetical protein [Nocardia asiatica]|uniref:hypothetical protein n=1 Tax=Nocardia asiatica TaxID=209252 RepID=UPI0002FF8ED7|nr:hypothetical protein [Nocardia asiatica]
MPSDLCAPLTVTDTELADVLDTFLFTVTDRDDVKAVLHAALTALHGRLIGKLRNEIVVWPVGDAGELLLTVDTASGLRLASRTIPLAAFTDANEISATDTVRHVLHELLRHHYTLTTTAAAVLTPPPGRQPARTRNGYVYRVVVDSYPTLDRRPFTAQNPDVWGLVGTPDAPVWLPGEQAMRPWLRTSAEHDGEAYYTAPDFSGRFTRCRTARRWLGWALDLGCTAHLERARIGEFTRHDTTPLRDTTIRPLRGGPPRYDDPPF